MKRRWALVVIALCVELPLWISMLVLSKSTGPADAPSIGWVVFLTQIPGVAMARLVAGTNADFPSMTEEVVFAGVILFVQTLLLWSLLWIVSRAVSRSRPGAENT